MSLVNKIDIKKIRLNKEYCLQGVNKDILINSSGINLELKSLSSIRILSNLEPIKTIIDYYPELRILNLTGSLNLAKLLGSKKSKEYGNYLKTSIEDSLKLITNYHTEIFPIRKKCYQNLSQVLMNDNALELPLYNHAGITGRTSITKGFNFLTMKKENRKLLKSRNNNCLVEVDFKSCEPFFYLKSNNYSLDETRDIYQWISENYNVNIKSRDKFKRGILSMLYGANEYTTSKVMQIDLSTVKKIKQELGINSLKDRLTEEYEKNNFILNYYGRPITSNNNLVNYWIQSSTVDFCSLAFYNFYNHYKLKPCFFIHDSMTFEIEKNRIDMLKNIKAIKEPKSNISIPVEFNILTE